MLLAIAISTFMGLLAALVLVTLFASLRQGVFAWFQIRAELAAMDRAERLSGHPAALPLRQPQAAFALLAA